MTDYVHANDILYKSINKFSPKIFKIKVWVT